MKAVEMSEPLSPTQRLSIDDIATSLGLTGDEGEQLAMDMQDEGWAILDFGPTPPKLRLTLAGKKAVAKFHLPQWRRWIDDNPGI